MEPDRAHHYEAGARIQRHLNIKVDLHLTCAEVERVSEEERRRLGRDDLFDPSLALRLPAHPERNPVADVPSPFGQGVEALGDLNSTAAREAGLVGPEHKLALLHRRRPGLSLQDLTPGADPFQPLLVQHISVITQESLHHLQGFAQGTL